MPTLQHPRGQFTTSWGKEVSWIPPPPTEKFIAKLDRASLVRLQDGCQEPRTSNCHLLEPSLTLINLGSNKTKLGKLQWIIIKSFRSMLIIFLEFLQTYTTYSKLWCYNQASIIHELSIIVKMIIHMPITSCISYTVSCVLKINSERQTFISENSLNPGMNIMKHFCTLAPSKQWSWWSKPGRGGAQWLDVRGERIKSFNLCW